MIYLEPRQLQALKARAHRLGISVAELIRRMVSDGLEHGAPTQAAPPDVYQRLVGLGHSGLRDIAERHDAYLGQDPAV